MKLHDKKKPGLDEMVTIDISVGELLSIYAVFGSMNESDINNAYESILGKERAEQLITREGTYNSLSDFVYDGATESLYGLGVLK